MTEQDRNGEPAECPAQPGQLEQAEREEAEQTVRLQGRLVGLPMSRTALPQLLWLTASMISG
jgi:hypothetical protein